MTHMDRRTRHVDCDSSKGDISELKHSEIDSNVLVYIDEWITFVENQIDDIKYQLSDLRLLVRNCDAIDRVNLYHPIDRE